jgi:phospholysine phosphohistidine inorganic pyrophosphate phosphatase
VTVADACIIDLDGTLYVGDRTVPGAPAAVAALRSAGIPVCFATNTTRRPRSALVSRLGDMGFEIGADELHTAPLAAARWLERQGARRVSLLLAEATFEEFAGFERDDREPDHVVVGDLAEAWSFEVLNTAFRALTRGARLVAIQKNRSWDAGQGLQLDAGPFVAALEYATGQQAVVVGKPSPAFFDTAAAALRAPPERIVVVGDSLVNDVRGGHQAGCLGVAVRTGTFREEDLAALECPPDAVLDSIAYLPGWLGVPGGPFE